MDDAGIQALIEVVFFEKEGMDYYRMAAERALNPATRALFEMLVEDEKKHVDYLSGLHDRLSAGGEWPDEITISPEKDFKAIFVEASRSLAKDIAVTATETEALERAIEMENKGRAMYLELSEKAANQTEKRLYAMLAEWELGHANYIQDYYNYFQDHGMFMNE